MPNTSSARKRMRQSEKRGRRNQTQRSQLRTAIKNCMSATDADEATAAFRRTTALLDRYASKNLLHANKAARKKAQLARHVRELGGEV